MSDYDTLGTAIRHEATGTWSAHLLFIADGKVIREELLATGRTLTYALRECTRSTEMFSHGLIRGKYELIQPNQKGVKIT